MIQSHKIKIIGAGLSGCEAALQLSKRGYQIDLYEMRPKLSTAAHSTSLFAELVCSNSLKSNLLSTASGLLKAELRILDCELLKIAEEVTVPAGNALAVDRILFSEKVTDIVKTNKNINFINEEYISLDNEPTILACGPLMSDSLTQELIRIIGDEHLYFFDAIAPVVDSSTIDYGVVFEQSRGELGTNKCVLYGQLPPAPLREGGGDYLNCPFSKEEYNMFIDALLIADQHSQKEFENAYFKKIDFKYYENCLPIEEIARRGRDSLRFGVMKPVRLTDPKTGKRPYAVIQLRTENQSKSAYNLVGCQTMMKYESQKKVFQLIPGLNQAEFYRYGSIHRNTYLNTPLICKPDFSLIKKPNIRLAGQLTGVEGYVESILSGLLTAMSFYGGIGTDNFVLDRELPEVTIVGQLYRHLFRKTSNFIPMNANFGILPDIEMLRKNKSLKKAMYVKRSLEALGRGIDN